MGSVFSDNILRLNAEEQRETKREQAGAISEASILVTSPMREITDNSITLLSPAIGTTVFNEIRIYDTDDFSEGYTPYYCTVNKNDNLVVDIVSDNALDGKFGVVSYLSTLGG